MTDLTGPGAMCLDVGRPMRRLLIAASLATLYATAVLATLGDYGITWDEPFYAAGGTQLAAWLRHPRWTTLDAAWWNPADAHPPLVKLAAGLSAELFHARLGWTGELTGFRLGPALLAWPSAFALSLWALELLGATAGTLAALCYLLMPRPFFDAHLAALDAPLSGLWLLAAFAFARAERGGRWLAAAAALTGLTLLTKVTGFFLYAALLGVLLARRAPRRQVLTFLLVPPALFFTLWPWLWAHPVSRAWTFLSFHLHHYGIPVYYLGRIREQAPWHYPFVLTAVTTPVPVLLLATAGAGAIAWRPSRDGWLILLLALLPLGFNSFPWTPKYDGVRLFLPAFPFIALLAGFGVKEALERFPARRGAVLAACALALGLTAWRGIPRYHPYEASYYNALVGGLKGATQAGFETSYWGEAYQDLLPWMARHPELPFAAPLGDHLFAVDKGLGLLPPGVTVTKEGPGATVLLSRQGLFGKDPRLWEAFRKGRVLTEVSRDGTRLAAIYAPLP